MLIALKVQFCRMLKIKASSKILELAKSYPFLMDALTEISPKLKKLSNPILQKSIGKRATLTDVSKIAKVPLNIIFKRIADAILKNTGEKVEIDSADQGKGDWQEELLKRQGKMKELVLELHGGGEVGHLQKKFKDIITDISASEVADMEQSLISAGELTAEQVTSMCDLHVEIFKESLDVQVKPETTPGHPIHTYMKENERAQKFINVLKENPKAFPATTEIKKILLHYTRLENQLFPLLEKAEITGPSTVMWAKHDEIKEMFNNITEANFNELLTTIEDMIYKETNILFPMALENLSEYDWVKVRTGEEEIGYAWVEPGNLWKPITPLDIHQSIETTSEPEIKLNTGSLTLKEIDLILRNLPLDISFVKPDETVKYYSATDDRIFPRSPAVIGRAVVNCHPRKSFEKVQQILTSFKEGTKDKAMFWIQMGGKFLIISYYAIRDEGGIFMGTLEVSQDVTELRNLEGEKRLLDWK